MKVCEEGGALICINAPGPLKNKDKSIWWCWLCGKYLMCKHLITSMHALTMGQVLSLETLYENEFMFS